MTIGCGWGGDSSSARSCDVAFSKIASIGNALSSSGSAGGGRERRAVRVGIWKVNFGTGCTCTGDPVAVVG